jgi:hypothetical protein
MIQGYPMPLVKYLTPENMARKTYGRIFVPTEEHVARVLEIMKAIDENEFTVYMPEKLVVAFSPEESLIFLHKFEMDKNAILFKCWSEGIPVWIVDGQQPRDF